MVRSKGRMQIRKGLNKAACAQLLLYVQEMVRPGEADATERLFAFVHSDLEYLSLRSHIIPLITYFVAYERPTITAGLAVDLGRSLQEYVGNYTLALRQEEHRQRQQQAFSQFLSTSVLWPVLPSHVALPIVMERQREVSLDGDGVAGQLWSEKLGRFVQYESLLELGFFLKLEHAEGVVFYQEQPFRLEYTWQEKPRIYTPDVFFVLKDGRGIIAEVKARYYMGLYTNMVKWPVLREYCRQHGYGRLITDGRITIQSFWHHTIPAPFQKSLLDTLLAGPLAWREYRQIRETHQATWTDFVAVILRNHLIWTLHPFKLRCPM